MNIEITPKKTDGLERLIEVSVPVETVRDAEEKAARRYASSVRLPGFRPGKAPPAMVKKRFEDAIRQEAIEALVQEAFKEVMEREKLKSPSQPHVHDLKFEEGQPLTFELHVEVRPRSSWRARRDSASRARSEPSPTTRFASRSSRCANRRRRGRPSRSKPRRATWSACSSRRPTSTATFPEAREYPLVLGGGQAIPGIEELIMELKPGETIERPVSGPRISRTRRSAARRSRCA